VLHLTSYVTARLKDGLDALDVIGSVFPAGTVSGAPKVRAMEIIAETETIARGPYAGAIGWLGLDNGRVDLDTGILIRTMWFRDGMVHWQTGAGIVFDSDPDREWQEVHNKARVLAEVLAGQEEGDVFAHR
jgi:anthranilate synthase component 1